MGEPGRKPPFGGCGQADVTLLSVRNSSCKSDPEIIRMYGGRKMYDPKPINVEDVVLPEDLMELTEKIAENVHDVWAEGRMKEGWTYGPAKDPGKKETPLLVPYGELPDSEKSYDRNTALATLKLIVKMGYTISKDGEE